MPDQVDWSGFVFDIALPEEVTA